MAINGTRQMETDGFGGSLEERGFFKRSGSGGGPASVTVRIAPVIMESGGFGDSTDERIFFTGPPSSRGPDQTARAAARKAAVSLMRRFVARGVEDEAHCERVATWSRRLAKELGLSSERVLDVELGALLHDIGYIGLQGDPFPRRGPVTAEEWLQFRRHPELGVALLEPVPVLHRAIPLVAAHEEHFDGTGYPRGLKGTQIPISARIFHLVDAYEAMTGARAPGPRMADAKARFEIELGVGSRYDPIVFAAFDCIDPSEWCGLVATLR